MQQRYSVGGVDNQASLRDALVTVDSLTIVLSVLKRAMMMNLSIVITLTDFLRTILTDSR